PHPGGRQRVVGADRPGLLQQLRVVLEAIDQVEVLRLGRVALAGGRVGQVRQQGPGAGERVARTGQPREVTDGQVAEERRGRAQGVDTRENVVETDTGLVTLQNDVGVIRRERQAPGNLWLDDKADGLGGRGRRLQVGVVTVLTIE